MFATSIVIAGLMAAQTPVSQSQDLTITPGATLTGTGIYARAASDCDDFNRANGPMTGNWVDVVGSQQILNNAGYGGVGTGNQWMESTSANCAWDQSATSLEFFPNTGGNLKYAAIVTGTGATNNFFIKLQSQGSTLYNFAGFYQGFNGGGWSGGSGFTAVTPVSDGRMDVWYDSGTDEIVLDIDEFNDGNIDYTYRSGNASVVGGSAGSGHGIGTYGDQEYDNWDLNDGCGGGGPTLSTSGSCPGAITFTVSGGTGTYALLYGPAGSFTAGSGVCAGTTVDINPPTLGAVMGASLTANVPSAGCGLTVQAVDLGTCTPTNAIVL